MLLSQPLISSTRFEAAATALGPVTAAATADASVQIKAALNQAVAIAVRECRAASSGDALEKIIFACFDANMLALYEAALAESRPCP